MTWPLPAAENQILEKKSLRVVTGKHPAWADLGQNEIYPQRFKQLINIWAPLINILINIDPSLGRW
jgi:hypothetical protein